MAILDLDAHPFCHAGILCVRAHLGGFQRPAGQRRDFTGNAGDAEAVTAVRRHRDFKQPVLLARARLPQ